MCIFQSEQVIKFRNLLVSLEKSSGHQIRQLDCHVVGPMPGHYQKYTQKTVQHCRAEDCLAIDME